MVFQLGVLSTHVLLMVCKKVNYFWPAIYLTRTTLYNMYNYIHSFKLQDWKDMHGDPYNCSFFACKTYWMFEQKILSEVGKILKVKI